MSNNKTEVLSAEAARALFAKEKKPLKIKPEKKVQGAKAEMNIDGTPESAALMAITINRKGQNVAYFEGKAYIEYDQGGRTWRIKPEEVKP